MSVMMGSSMHVAAPKVVYMCSCCRESDLQTMTHATAV
jgi:hypothetical protein